MFLGQQATQQGLRRRQAEVGITSLAPKKKKTKKLLLLSAGIERDYPPFFEFSLCLSRACLGKMFVFI
jgi:hypothetical protein